LLWFQLRVMLPVSAPSPPLLYPSTAIL
jgi:hypothetical protein